MGIDVSDFYVEKTGCRWRQLPSAFPSWKRVYNTCRGESPSRAATPSARAPRTAERGDRSPSVKTVAKASSEAMPREEDQRSQTAHGGRYARAPARDDRALGRHPGSCGCSAGPRRCSDGRSRPSCVPKRIESSGVGSSSAALHGSIIRGACPRTMRSPPLHRRPSCKWPISA